MADDQGRVVAKTITVDGDDLETAQMVEAGLHPTAQQVAANIQGIETNKQSIAANAVQLAAHKETIQTHEQNIAGNKQQIDENIKDIEENTQRFTALSEYDVKGQATVKFNIGSTAISANDEQQLKDLAQSATGRTWIHYRGDGFCRLNRQRCDEHNAERAARKSGCHLSHPARWGADKTYRGSGRHG